MTSWSSIQAMTLTDPPQRLQTSALLPCSRSTGGTPRRFPTTATPRGDRAPPSRQRVHRCVGRQWRVGQVVAPTPRRYWRTAVSHSGQP